MTKRSLYIGMFVEPSDKHRQQFPTGIKRRGGRIVGTSRYTERCWRVKWLNVKQPETLHEKFLRARDGEKQDSGERK